MTILRGLLLLPLLAAVSAAPVSAVEAPRLIGFVRLSAGAIDAAPTFLDGGFGKLVDGGRPGEDAANAFLGEARLALDWELGAGWGFFVHGVARQDAASRDSSSGSGLLEAFAERRFEGEWHLWTLRAGQFFLPASRENVGSLWTSPYTLTLSAMNSWIAEEIRPIGLDLSYTRTFTNDHRLHLAGLHGAG